MLKVFVTHPRSRDRGCWVQGRSTSDCRRFRLVVPVTAGQGVLLDSWWTATDSWVDSKNERGSCETVKGQIKRQTKRARCKYALSLQDQCGESS